MVNSGYSDNAGSTPRADGTTADRRGPGSRLGLGLMLGALGVVYGDIGTSPLYSMQTVFSIDHGRVRPNAHDVFGVASLVVWSITLIVSIKYVLLVMRADNDGEGGVMALAALARRALGRAGTRRAAVVMVLGVLGAALFYGDSVITPAVSVLSAVEGIQVDDPSLGHLVLPLSAVILAALFAIQRFGTHRVGGLFGPVMLVWFCVIGAMGLVEVIHHPDVLRALSPSYAVVFFADEPFTAFIALGAVVLAITGAEALYADMGQFGPSPIRRSWFVLVFPALVLNYLAQGALIQHRPNARTNPFFLLFPHWAQLPMVVLATAATVIAAQAVITGAYSMTRQALRLGFLPNLRIRQTSREREGQIYMPAVNWLLLAAVLAVTLGFRASSRLANAYGVAVTGTFLITTTLLLIVARRHWRWSYWRVIPIAIVFGGIEAGYFAANLTKVTHGGWLTLLIAAIVFVVMTTWQRGRTLVTQRRAELEDPIGEFVTELHRDDVYRAPGIAVFPHPNPATTPLALRANLEINNVLHERIIIISSRTANVPHVPWDRRLTIADIGSRDDRLTHITAVFGFQDTPHFPEVLRHAAPSLADVDDAAVATASYIVSRVTLRQTNRPDMARWRKALFVTMAHNSPAHMEMLDLPVHRTLIVSAEVLI